jgi:hypothetical protein
MMRYAFLYLSFLLTVLRIASAQSLVNCPIDCTATPNVTAEIDACLAAQATLCNTEVRVIPRVLWEELLGITNASIVNATYPANFTYLPTNETVPRVSCDGLVFNEVILKQFFFICVETTFCYIDPLAQVTVELNGTCDAALLDAPGVGSVYYLGPATIVGGGFVVSRDWQTQITFENILWDGGGTSDPLLADCALNSNLTMLDVNITGFVGDYAFKAEACAYDVWIVLNNLHMNDIPGTALYFEGLFGFVLFNFLCERCAQRNNSECVHIMMSKASRAVLDIENPNCFRIADLLPPRCRYCLTGDDGFCGSRCNEGEVQVYDREATAAFANCPMIDFAFTDYFTMLPLMMPEFDPVCRVWSPPLCNFLRVVNSQNFSQSIAFPGGDIVWDFDAPLICVPGGTISPLPGPFFITEFDNNLGDPVPIVALPPLPTPPAFVDPSFEDFGVRWNTTILITDPSDINFVYGSANAHSVLTQSPPKPARTGDWVMLCHFNTIKGVHQPVQAVLADVGVAQTLEFWGLRQSGERFHFTDKIVQLLIDGVEQDRVDEPTFSNTLVANDVYYMFTLQWTPADTLPHTLSLVCDFSIGGVSNYATLQVEDLAWQAPWAGNAVTDPSFEPHSLSWVDVPVGEAILDEADTPCPARTGTHLLYCGEQGFDRTAQQSVTFTEDGVYTLAFYAQRRNGLANYAGASLNIITNVLVGSTPIDAAHFPNDDTYYALFGEGGGFVISGAPVTIDVGFDCNFIGAAGTANLCIDDVQIVAMGTIGVTASTLGFSSQTISSEPTIDNKTCDCSNFTAPVVNSTLTPCAYALDNDTVCVEQVPYCCVSDYLPQFILIPHILAANCSCTDLNADPPCVFLMDCNTLLGDVRECREFTCPFNASEPSLPFDSLPNAFQYLLVNCTENTAVLLNYTDSLLYPNGSVTDGGNWTALYSPKPKCGVLDFAEEPTAFFQNCPFADNDACLLYAFCDPNIVFDDTDDSYQINNCTQLNCTVLGVPIITLQSQFALCDVLATNVTLAAVSGGWTFSRLNDSAVMFDEAMLLFYLEALAENCGSDPIPIFELTNQSALVPDCGPPAYFRVCPCCPSNETFTVPANSSQDDPTQTDDFYTCTNGVATCRCNDPALQASNPPPANSITYHIVLAPDTLRTYRFINARAQQHLYGQRIDQVNYELPARNTIAEPHFYDDRAICRLSIRNDNEFCRGSPATGGADCLQGNPHGPYSRECNIVNIAGPGPARECPWTYGRFALIKTEEDCNCIVDDRATDDLTGFGTTIFPSVTDALAGCSKDVICARASTKSAYYEENVAIEKANKNIFLVTLPSEGAIIVGTHEIRTNADNVTLVGFRFIHPADNQRPLFSIIKGADDSNLEQLNILNCVLDGSGCRKCGVVDTKRLNDLLINYTRFNEWEFFTVKLDDAHLVTIAGSVFNSTVGRSLLVKYTEGFVVDEVAFVDARGGEQLKGAAITSFTAKNDDACDRSNTRHSCLFRYVVQHVRTTDEVPRFSDICYYFARGRFNISGTLYDVACRLAQDGVVFLKMINVGSAELTELMEANPMNRPQLFQLAGQPLGHDWVLRSSASTVSSDGDTLFRFNDDVNVNYDEAPFTLPFDLRCESNVNWDLRFAFGVGVELPRHGSLRFHNTSILLEFCFDRRMAGWFDPSLLDQPAFIGYVRVFNGSKIVPDRLTASRDAYLIGDDVGACCHVNAIIEGLGHRIHTERLNMTDLTFTMPPDPEELDMWSSGPQDYDVEQLSAEQAFSQTIPAEIMLLRVYADGREILPMRKMWAFNLLVGVEQAPQFFDDITNKPPPPTYMRMIVNDSYISNFLALNSDTSPDEFNFVEAEYPYANGMHVQFFNRLNATSLFEAFNLTVRDVDSYGLEVLFPNNLTIQNSSFFNCSGRALGNEACVKLQGNDVSKLIKSSKNFNATAFFLATPCHMFFLNNTCLHTNDVLFPRDNRGAQPGWCACYQLMGYADTCEYCVMNGSTKGLPLGLREDETRNTTINQCPLYTAPAPVAWPDLARYLRGQCIAGHLEAFSGTQHDLGFGHKTTDMFGETYFCDSLDQFSCCALIDPEQCYVTQSPQMLVPSNPWLGQFVFASLNDAIVNCNATTRVIIVLGSDDVFRIGDYSPKVYTEVLSATVPVVSVRGVGGPMVIFATKGVTWRSVGNFLDTQCVTVTFRDFVFDHDGTLAAAIWDQPAPGDGSCGLHLYNNFWNVSTDGWAIRAYAGDSFWVSHNSVRGLSVTRRAIEVRGNGTCTDRDVRVVHNDVRHVLGVGVDVIDLSCPIVSYNKLEDVGGQDGVTAIPYSLHVDICATAVPKSQECVVIKRNFVRTTQIVSAVVGLMATCWFDPVPLSAKKIRIQENDCRGLEIGIRFNNMPDTSPSGDPKAQLRAFCAKFKNGFSKGLLLPPLNRRFDLVRGPPSDDASLVADPDIAANKGRWCTDCCPKFTEVLLWTLLGVLGLLLLMILAMCLVTGCCTPANLLYPVVNIVKFRPAQPSYSPYDQQTLSPFYDDPRNASIPSAAMSIGSERASISSSSMLNRRRPPPRDVSSQHEINFSDLRL